MGSVEQVHADEGSVGWLERLAGTVGGSVQAQAVHGQPVEREGVTVIPVARVSYGFGGARRLLAFLAGAGLGAWLLFRGIRTLFR